MTEQEDVALRDAVAEALRMIIDPEIGGNIVDLGLVYGIRASGTGLVEITMTTTTRGCPASGYLRQAVCDCAENVPGVEYVQVHLTYEPQWSPDMMRETGTAHRLS
jgi:metal-sulfur cluster biosynthetic enzyme